MPHDTQRETRGIGGFFTSQVKRTFITGAAVLAAAGLIGKIIGAVYRVVLASVIGPEGTGLWQMAYPTYSLLVVISSAGLPAAISRLVAERVATGDDAGARRVFSVSLKLLLVVGVVTTLAQGLLAQALSSAQGNPAAAASYVALAPALLFVSVMSAYRGYFQGMQRMTPTSVSQIIEQVGKLALGYLFASWFMPLGVQYAAAGAMLGISISELAALVVMMGAWAGYRHTHTLPKPSTEPFMSVAKRLAIIAIPITIGASIMPLVNMADAAIVIRRLTAQGFAVSDATSMYGILTGIVNPIVNMPAVITLSLSMSLVPALSAARVSGRTEDIRLNASVGLKLALLLGLPCSVGIYLLAEPIVWFLYGGRLYSDANLALGSDMLRLMSLGMLFLSVVQTTTGIMQGIGRLKTPLINLAIGAGLKIVINFILIGIPSINITGAPIGSIVCYGVAATLNVIAMIRYSGVRLNPATLLLRPALSAAGMGGAVLLCMRLMGGALSTSVVTLASVGVGIIVYLALLLLTGSLTQQDCAMLPGGARIMRAFPRFIRQVS